MSRIISIGTSVPKYSTNQSTILDFMQEAYADEIVSRKLNLLFRNSGISKRYSVISDFDFAAVENPSFFNSHHQLPRIEERLNLFKDNAVPLALSAIRNAIEIRDINMAEFGFTHLITVTCTGMHSPGLDAELIEMLHLPNDIFHTAVNFLGCNAAFHALKYGDLICRTNSDAKILIVCVELCTLHFQPKNNNDNLLSNTLFGDGAASIILTSDAFAEQNHFSGLTINGFYSLLLSNAKHLMGWNITPVNFEMILDSKIPEVIGSEIINILHQASIRNMIQPSSIKRWAIHPGGKKILDTIKKQLELAEKDLCSSYKILDEYGNMSSPTILFVLKDIIENQLRKDDIIFSIGFGPGLSIETAFLTYAE